MQQKERTPTLCHSMDGSGEHYAEWNMPGSERQIPYDLICKCNLINKINQKALWAITHVTLGCKLCKWIHYCHQVFGNCHSQNDTKRETKTRLALPDKLGTECGIWLQGARTNLLPNKSTPTCWQLPEIPVKVRFQGGGQWGRRTSQNTKNKNKKIPHFFESRLTWK